MSVIAPKPVEERAATLAGRVRNATIEMMDLMTIYLGERLGFYLALVQLGEATPAQLSRHTGTNERYTREWLEQQAVTGILDVVDTGSPSTRRYSLPPGHDVALTERDSLAFVAPLARLSWGKVSALPAVVEAFRSGAGVPYEAYGDDMREGIAEANRPMFANLLAQAWLPAIPDLHARLQDSQRPARVADIGCGSGWSSIAIARGYPAVLVHGLDLDGASIEAARANAAKYGLGDRVTFHACDAGDPALEDRYDLACAFECIHDMADPVGTLRAMRGLVGAGGTVLVGDERVADSFMAPGDTTERLMFGASVLHCLPVGMAESPSAATGAVMRTDVLRGYARDAGFQAVEVLPIENEVWRFYRLTP